MNVGNEKSIRVQVMVEGDPGGLSAMFTGKITNFGLPAFRDF